MSLSHLMRSAGSGPLAALWTDFSAARECIWGPWQRYDFKDWVSWAPPGDFVHPELLWGPGTEYERWCHSKSGYCLQQAKTGSSYISCQPLQRNKPIKLFLNSREGSNWFVQTKKDEKQKRMKSKNVATIPGFALELGHGEKLFLK